ncbi:hypothetical protein EVA_17348 [gut metagenome]|uniref:Uncharacterized protein n=1 Tax=gut metagenome TaxID=749906 RepID=J9FI53_9ZZZZ
MTNRDACTRERSLVAVIAGTKSEDVIAVLQRIDEENLLSHFLLHKIAYFADST